MICLTSARFNMSALILSPGRTDTIDPPSTPAVDASVPAKGRYEYIQDPDSGDLIRTWIAEQDTVIELPAAVTGGLIPGRRFKCIARGFTDGGIRVAGTTERFSSRGLVETVDYITIKFPPSVLLTRRDRVTDIRNNKNVLLWKEEEHDDKPTVFEVNGVTPIIDPFGNHVENSALLQRAEIQGDADGTQA